MIETYKHLGHAFKKLHFLLEQTMNRRLQELELTNAQGHVIGHLTRSKEAPCPRDLETTYGLSHATVSGILSRMEAKGFIGFRADEQDRRVKRIYLLEKGMACSKGICQRIEESEQTMTEGFTEEELEQFRSYLQRAICNLERVVRENPCNREE